LNGSESSIDGYRIPSCAPGGWGCLEYINWQKIMAKILMIYIRLACFFGKFYSAATMNKLQATSFAIVCYLPHY
jgi:hypothetical protein